MMSAPNASSNVAGNRSPRSLVTGWRVRNEVPRSPWNRLPIYVVYCLAKPPSRPHFFLAALTTSGLLSWRSPTMLANGSDEMNREMPNEMVTIPSSRNGTITSRRRTNRLIGSVGLVQLLSPSNPRSRLQQAL